MEQTWWQMLPIGPTGYGDSPYQSPSTFAGNALLIDLEDLAALELLPATDLANPPPFPRRRVDYGSVLAWRRPRLHRAAHHFTERATADLRRGREAFVERHGTTWLDDFAVFMALKRANGLKPWWEWDPDLANAEPDALARVRRDMADDIDAIITEQFLVDDQFTALRTHADQVGVRLIGDIPIFVAHDSADVWANRRLFHLDDTGMPTFVAGVPPDYFSKTGQRWGNPLYRWEEHAADGFTWWTSRLERVFELFDLVRVDHFRGFAASWHVPAESPTAIEGAWVPAPGTELFDHLESVFGTLPVIAEDLGVITADVEALRDRYGFPGMKILQFGFGTESAHALDQFRPNVVAYTGTHDNDTAIGWFEDPSPERVAERRTALSALNSDGRAFHWDLIEAVAESVADTAVFPLQDLLGLGSEARMNLPATTEGNWQWRFEWSQLDNGIVDRMRRLTIATGRSPAGTARRTSDD